MIPKFENFKAKKSGGSREILPTGGYVCKILKAEVQTFQWGSKLVIFFDIAGTNHFHYHREVLFLRRCLIKEIEYQRFKEH